MTITELYSIYLQSSGIATDTRKIEKGNLFFALKGSNFNGNAFAEQAIKNGALGAVVDDIELSNPEKGLFYFENSLFALQNLARYHRNQLHIPVIGLTGSNGKTTTKELIASVLAEKYKVLYTQGNLNNHIGVPLTILSINSKHEVAIIEMGANHLKEIELLSSISQPSIGYITNFGRAHLEGFGGKDGVIKGKSELYTYLRKYNQYALVNTDDPLQVTLSDGIKRITFGSQGTYTFSHFEDQHRLSIQYQDIAVNSQLTGDYNFSNLCAAFSLGLYFEIDIEQIKKGIENYTPQNQRSQIVEKNNVILVLDTYNANPSSMEVSLENFSHFKGSKSVIIGDMYELGIESALEHQRILNLAESLNFDFIYLVGNNFYSTISTNCNKIQKFHTTSDMADFLKNYTIPTKNILLKGSRAMALERLIEFLP